MLRGFLLGIVITVLAIVGYGYFVVTSGDVPAWAANATPLPLERWAATTSLRANLAHYALKGANPVPLTEANLLTGIDLYGRNCAICHGTGALVHLPRRLRKANIRSRRNLVPTRKWVRTQRRITRRSIVSGLSKTGSV